MPAILTRLKTAWNNATDCNTSMRTSSKADGVYVKFSKLYNGFAQPSYRVNVVSVSNGKKEKSNFTLQRFHYKQLKQHVEYPDRLVRLGLGFNESKVPSPEFCSSEKAYCQVFDLLHPNHIIRHDEKAGTLNVHKNQPVTRRAPEPAALLYPQVARLSTQAGVLNVPVNKDVTRRPPKPPLRTSSLAGAASNPSQLASYWENQVKILRKINTDMKTAFTASKESSSGGMALSASAQDMEESCRQFFENIQQLSRMGNS